MNRARRGGVGLAGQTKTLSTQVLRLLLRSFAFNLLLSDGNWAMVDLVNPGGGSHMNGLINGIFCNLEANGKPAYELFKAQ